MPRPTNFEILVENVIRSVALGRLEVSPRLSKRDKKVVKLIFETLPKRNGKAFCPFCQKYINKGIVHLKRKHYKDIVDLVTEVKRSKKRDKSEVINKFIAKRRAQGNEAGT